MSPAALELKETIRRYCLEEGGFDLFGVSDAELPGFHGQAMEEWVARGMAGEMAYLERDGRKRAEPKSFLPWARSVISLAVGYNHPEDPRPAAPAGRVARYAYGSDYHNVIQKRLKKLVRFIAEAGGPGTECRVFVDTGPVLEKAFAQQAGLGFFGKNTNLIAKTYGSWIFLASVITSLELPKDEPHTGACGSCRLCLDACPTGALLGDYKLDARRCIAYLTIEAKSEPPAELKAGMGEWIFGCDICQEVCPYNRRAPLTRHADLYPNKKAGSWIELDALSAIPDEAAYALAYQGSPLRRPKLSGMLRNAQVVRENLEK